MHTYSKQGTQGTRQPGPRAMELVSGQGLRLGHGGATGQGQLKACGGAGRVLPGTPVPRACRASQLGVTMGKEQPLESCLPPQDPSPLQMPRVGQPGDEQKPH